MKYFPQLIILFLYISNIACLSRALHYSEEKCFIDNYYDGMSIIIEYKILDKDIKKVANNGFKITITSTETSHFKLFYSSKLTGKISYSFEESDKYRICISTSDKELFKNKKFLYLQFKIQSYDDLYDENTATAKDFNKVNETMTKLNSKVDNIESNQNYQLKVEDIFSAKQIKASSRMAVVSLVQIGIICIVGIYHIISLRTLFKNKIWTPF